MEPCLWLERFTLHAKLKPRTARSVGQRLTTKLQGLPLIFNKINNVAWMKQEHFLKVMQFEIYADINFVTCFFGA